MKLNELKDRPGSRKARIRVGRGIGSGKGKTGGRGVKGQKSRTGVRIKGFEGGQMPLHRRLPKRGFTNIHAKPVAEVTLARIQAALDKGTLSSKGDINYEALVAAGVAKAKCDSVKLIATGELKTKISITVNKASKGAIAAVEKAGGKVTVLATEEAAA